MTKKDKESWSKRKDAESAGFEPKPWRGVRMHSNNTLKHEHAKFALCWVLDEMGRDWDTEVTCDTGRVDVFDFGPEDGAPVIYEIETGVTDSRKREKVNQYMLGPIRDVIVVNPADVPSDIEEAVEYFAQNVVIG
jgi:hypothetical protein